MGADGKALLDPGKALILSRCHYDNKAMLSTAENIKRKLAEVLASGVRQADIAAYCGVSKQAVQSWKNTGRIDKKHLPLLADVSRRPLSWWLESPDSHSAGFEEVQHIVPLVTAEEQGPYGSNLMVWPFKRIDRLEYTLLDETQRDLVEAYVRGMLDEARRNKRTATSRAA